MWKVNGRTTDGWTTEKGCWTWSDHNSSSDKDSKGQYNVENGPSKNSKSAQTVKKWPIPNMEHSWKWYTGLIFILNTVSFLEPLAQIHKEWDTVMWWWTWMIPSLARLTMNMWLPVAMRISLWTGRVPLLAVMTASHISPLCCSSYSCVDSRLWKPGTSNSLFSLCPVMLQCMIKHCWSMSPASPRDITLLKHSIMSRSILREIIIWNFALRKICGGENPSDLWKTLLLKGAHKVWKIFLRSNELSNSFYYTAT